MLQGKLCVCGYVWLLVLRFILALFIDMYVFLVLYIFTFSIFTVLFNSLCHSTFEQGHLEPMRYRDDFIIIVVIIYLYAIIYY